MINQQQNGQLFLSGRALESLDPDAQAFLVAAGITSEVKKQAINLLVVGLKTLPASGVKFWDRDYIIYPFVSNSTDGAAQRAISHSYNLKNPAGAYNLTYGADGVTHSDNGIQGAGAGNSYANTKYTPTTSLPAWNTSDCRIFGYVDARENPIVAGKSLWGSYNAAETRRVCFRVNAAVADAYEMNCTGTAIVKAPPDGAGSYLQQSSGATVSRAYNRGAIATIANTLVGAPDQPIYLCARRVGAGVAQQCNVRISGWSLGKGIFTQAEWEQYHDLWTTFQSALGRAKP